MWRAASWWVSLACTNMLHCNDIIACCTSLGYTSVNRPSYTGQGIQASYAGVTIQAQHHLSATPAVHGQRLSQHTHTYRSVGQGWKHVQAVQRPACLQSAMAGSDAAQVIAAADLHCLRQLLAHCKCCIALGSTHIYPGTDSQTESATIECC